MPVTKRYDAVVVGSGPNGLAAALTLARAGHSVRLVEAHPHLGGGLRSAALTLPGFVHDVCSAVHPLLAASPFFQGLALERHGLHLLHGGAPLAHGLDDGAAVLERSVEATAEGLGGDGEAYARLVGPLVRRGDELTQLLFGSPVRSALRAPLFAARFGLQALRSAFWLAEETFEGPKAKALFAGCAAHGLAPLTAPSTAALGLVLLALGHLVGWPVIRGGSGRLAELLARLFLEAGGEVETGRRVERLEELPPSRLVLFATHARVMVRVCGAAQPPWYRRLVEGVRQAAGSFKLDYALSGPMPWRDAALARAPTVHLGGPLGEVTASEDASSSGALASRPFVLVAQPSLFDGTRAPPGQHTLWAYCHVPLGFEGDATQAVEAQLERFAPGFEASVLARRVKRPADLEAENPSLLGGDISGGAVDGAQLLLRAPVATPNPRVLLCSSSTRPGPGVHGMCGALAAQVALRRLREAG